MVKAVVDDSWLTVAQIADMVQLSPITVRSWLVDGRLRGEKAGPRQWRVDPVELRRFLGDAHPATSPTSPRSDQLRSELLDERDSSQELDFMSSISRREQ
jgi:excisionase family DNA binding protein